MSFSIRNYILKQVSVWLSLYFWASQKLRASHRTEIKNRQLGCEKWLIWRGITLGIRVCCGVQTGRNWRKYPNGRRDLYILYIPFIIIPLTNSLNSKISKCVRKHYYLVDQAVPYSTLNISRLRPACEPTTRNAEKIENRSKIFRALIL